jgi:hypothetical protein
MEGSEAHMAHDEGFKAYLELLRLHVVDCVQSVHNMASTSSREHPITNSYQTSCLILTSCSITLDYCTQPDHGRSNTGARNRNAIESFDHVDANGAGSCGEAACVGAGIVADSEPDDEDLECRNKAAGLLAAIPAARRMTKRRREGGTKA